MAFFTARILSKDGVVITDDIEVWIRFFHLGNEAIWTGSCEVPVMTPFTQSTYRLQLTDGREGLISDLTTQIRGDNLAVSFEGQGPLA